MTVKTSSSHKFLFHFLILSFKICTKYICIHFWEGRLVYLGIIGLPVIFISISLDLALQCFLSSSKFNVCIIDSQITAGPPLSAALTAQ